MTDRKHFFMFVTEDLLSKEITNLDGSKSTPNGDISVNILKLTVHTHLPYKTNIINLSIKRVKGYFPDKVNLASWSNFKKGR